MQANEHVRLDRFIRSAAHVMSGKRRRQPAALFPCSRIDCFYQSPDIVSELAHSRQPGGDAITSIHHR
jgi:hypothetical protein